MSSTRSAVGTGSRRCARRQFHHKPCCRRTSPSRLPVMAEVVSRLTVLYDSGCALCSLFREWLAGQPALVRLDLVPAESAQARALFPGLDHARTMQEITVVGDDGSIWTGEHAW